MVGTVHYTYTLECGHTVIANVPENDTKSAYKVGQLVVCPQDHYAKKKIIDQSSSVSP
jgi:hypothetical protein